MEKQIEVLTFPRCPGGMQFAQVTRRRVSGDSREKLKRRYLLLRGLLNVSVLFSFTLISYNLPAIMKHVF